MDDRGRCWPDFTEQATPQFTQDELIFDPLRSSPQGYFRVDNVNSTGMGVVTPQARVEEYVEGRLPWNGFGPATVPSYPASLDNQPPAVAFSAMNQPQSASLHLPGDVMVAGSEPDMPYS
ncbi:hypothetical protein V5O48_016665, partial [Marasmius crinis-equi]